MREWGRIGRFVERHFGAVRKRQRTTIAALVVGLMRRQAIGLAQIARGMIDGTTVRHRIKRVGRFFSNDRVDGWIVTQCLVELLMPRDRRSVVVLDWTDRGDRMLLMASMIFRRRALPLAWRHVDKWVYEKSQNDEEQTLIERLAGCIGPERPWVLLADRGFGRAELFRWLNEQGIRFVIRTKDNVWIEHRGYSGRLANLPREPRTARRRGHVRYHKTKRVPVDLVVAHEEPAPDVWYLITNLDAHARTIQRLYAQRMGIEQCIRDCKSTLHLKRFRLSQAVRLDRAMILIAIALLLAALTAADSTRRGRDLQLATRKAGEVVLSFLRLGLHILEQRPQWLSTNASLLRSVR